MYLQQECFLSSFLLKTHWDSLCWIERCSKCTMSNMTGPGQHQVQWYSCVFEVDLVSNPPLAASQQTAAQRFHAKRCQVLSALLGDFCAPGRGQIILSLFERVQHKEMLLCVGGLKMFEAYRKHLGFHKVPKDLGLDYGTSLPLLEKAGMCW